MLLNDSRRVSIAFMLAVILPNALLASTIEHAVDTRNFTGFVNLVYGDHTTYSAIDSGGEVDTYTFQGAAGDSIRFIVSSRNYMDPVLTLRDSTGTVLRALQCGNHCSMALNQTLPSDGLYYLNVADVGSDETGGYTLHLERYPPANNWEGLSYDSPFGGELGHLGDMDFLAFNGSAGTGVQLSLLSLGDYSDPRLEVWDPNGDRIVDVLCSNRCSLAPTLDLSTSGIYKLGISDAGWDEAGSYSIGVSCLYGACPTEAPSPVPLPPALWLMGGGIAALCGIARRKTA